ncbi:flagellar basal body P-ring protein FlgI [Paramagnetospirillum kuznetsovii]|nr:flagellar basal body P-ring protein FlgI [Paramagnetospirillum kuznetsovii]
MKSLALAILLALATSPAWAQSRIKDMATIEGMGDAALVGYGMVVGLSGTGDTPLVGRGPLPPGVRVGRDAAQVMVTARLPAGAGAGSRMDVTIAAIGDARNLSGGVLLPTALEGGNGQVYAVAEGRLAVEGLAIQGRSQSISRGSATTAHIPGGATIERELPTALGQGGELRLRLRNPDFTTAKRMAETINAFQGQRLARIKDNGTIIVIVPESQPDGAAGLAAAIEGLRVTADQPASKVVVDAASGAIVAGLDVRLSPAAISHGALTIRVTEAHQVSQPPPFSSSGATKVVPRSSIDVDDSKGSSIITIPPGGTVGDLLRRLNAAQISTLDQIAILQALRSAGGLEGELVSR